MNESNLTNGTEEAVRDPYHNYFRMEIWTPIFVFTGLAFVVIVCLIAYCAYKLNQVPISRRIKRMSLLSLLSYLVAVLLFLLYVLYAKFPVNGLADPTKLQLATWSMYNTMWSLGYLFTYLLAFERQKIVFEQTKYSISKRNSVTFYVLITAYMVAQQAMSGAWMLFVYGHYSWDFFVKPYYGCLISKMAVDILLNGFIIYFFSSNMLQLHHQSRATIGRHVSAPHSVRLLNTMIKIFLLSCWCVASTLLYTLSEIILSVAIEQGSVTGDLTFYRNWYCVYFVMCYVDAIVSVLFVLLSFPFTDHYYQACCRPSHGCCVRMWLSATSPRKVKVRQSRESSRDELAEEMV